MIHDAVSYCEISTEDVYEKQDKIFKQNILFSYCISIY